MSKAQCLDCEDIIESKHRHNFVRCGCGNSFLDGGDSYIRAGGRIAIIYDNLKLHPLQQDLELKERLKDVDTDGYL
jgi:hypothetical protein